MTTNPNPDRRARYAAAIAEGFRAFDADTTADAYLDAELLDAVVAAADAELAEVLPAVSVVPPATNQTAPVDRAAVLREAADAVDNPASVRAANEIDAAFMARSVMATKLRRMADEAEPVAVSPDGANETAASVAAPAEPQPEPTAEDIARANVLALHQIGEQLAGIESWMWEHLADVRDAAKAQAAAGQPAAVDTSEDRCAECGHFRGAHEKAEEPVSVGRCTVCADEDERHDFEAVEELRRLAAEERDEQQAQANLDQLAEDLAAAIASCPGYEMAPSPCRCPCYGCKHHCGAHDPQQAGGPSREATEPQPSCVCGEPATPGTVHRADGPCYIAETHHTETPDEALHCVCGDPVQLMDDSDPTSWIHSPGSDTRCLEARPRCPHCQMPHDLTPGSPPVAVCASTRHRIAEAEWLHPQGDHSLCCRVDCDAIPAPTVVAQPGKETRHA